MVVTRPDLPPAALALLAPPPVSGPAYDTMRRGTRFLADMAAGAAFTTPWPAGQGGRIRALYLGNCLRELDRFLHVLMDEIAGEGPGRPLSLRHTTANKLGGHAHARWDMAADQTRLNALCRSRTCLFHDDGQVRRPDRPRGRWMTAGWPAPASTTLRRYAVGEPLHLSGADLADTCAFYQRLADRLVRA